MLRIIHTSDFHLSSEDPTTDKLQLIDAFVHSLADFVNDDTIIAFTGDCINQGGANFSDDPFIRFESLFINKIIEKFPKLRNRIFITPGNHDVIRNNFDEFTDFSLRESFQKNALQAESFVSKNKNDLKHYFKSIQPYKEFEKKFYESCRFEKDSWNWTYFDSSHILNVSNTTIGISCLNSSWLCYDSTDEGKLFVTDAQTKNSIEFIKNCKIKVCLVHHPFGFLHKEDYASIKPILYKYYDIILCGHTHKEECINVQDLDGQLYISIAKSLNGINNTDIRYQNGFSVIDYFENEKIEVTYKKYVFQKGSFVNNTDIGDDNGKKSFYLQKNVGKTTDTETQKKIPRISLKSYPKPKPYFAGRQKELEEIEEAYSSHTFILIEGAGGIGKTQIIAKVIENLALQTKTVWYECHPTSQVDDIIKGIGFSEILIGETKTNREKFSAFKDKIEEFELNIFLDNYQEVKNNSTFSDFLSFIDEYLTKGHVIIIDRDKNVSPALHPKKIHLSGLGDQSIIHAKQLISHTYPELKISDYELSKICSTFQGHPLTIDLAVYLLSQNVPGEEIIKESVVEAHKHITDTQTISQRLLNKIFTREDATQEEKNFLMNFSALRGKIHESVIKDIFSENEFKIATRNLNSKNLLSIENEYYEIHPLVREFSYELLHDKKSIHQRIASYYINQRDSILNVELEEKIFYHLSCSENWEEISKSISLYGGSMIVQGHLERLNQMINYAKEKGFSTPQFEMFEGDIFEVTGDWSNAKLTYDRLRETNDPSIALEASIKYGEMHLREGDTMQGLLLFEEILHQTEKDESRKIFYARVLNDIGIAYDKLGDLYTAIENLEKSLEIRETLDSKEDIANTLNNLGLTYRKFGDDKSALEFHLKALELRKEINAINNIPHSLVFIGNILLRDGRQNEANNLYQESFEISKDTGNKICLGNYYAAMANASLLQNNFTDALKNINQAIDIAEEINHNDAIANDYILLARIKELEEKYDEALHFLEKSLKIVEPSGDKIGISVLLNNMANLYHLKGNVTLAKDFYNRSYDYVKDTGAKHQLAVTLSNVGIINYLTSNTIEEKSQSIPLYVKSAALINFIRDNGEKRALKELKKIRPQFSNFKSLVTKAYNELEDQLKTKLDLYDILGSDTTFAKPKSKKAICFCGSGKQYRYCHGKNA